MINKPLNVYQLSMINKERYILNSDEIKKNYKTLLYSVILYRSLYVTPINGSDILSDLQIILQNILLTL